MGIRQAEGTGLNTPGSLEGSEGRAGVMNHLFNDAPPASPDETGTEGESQKTGEEEAHDTKPEKSEETPETGEQETVQKPADEPDAEGKETVKEHTPEEYAEAYDRVIAKEKSLDEGLAKLDKQGQAMDRKFTEQSEEFAALRKEAGVEEAHKSNKDIRKTGEKMGSDAPAIEYVQKEYFSKEVLDALVQKNVVTARELPLVKSLVPVLNVMLNGVAHGMTGKLNEAMTEFQGQVQPIVADREVTQKNSVRFGKWGTHLTSYVEKHGNPTAAQQKALQGELGNSRFFDLVDDSTPEEMETAIRRLYHDPGVEQEDAFAPPPPKTEPKTKVKFVEAGSEEGSPPKRKRGPREVLEDTVNYIFDRD